MKEYTKPLIHDEQFVSNQFIAGCSANIVSGTSPVNVYCVKTSHITVFTSTTTGGCTYKRDPFTSTAEASSFFSSLFQWSDAVSEQESNNKSFTQAQMNAGNAEIDNGWPKRFPNTIVVGTQHGKTHAGYALDFLQDHEGKYIS